MKEFSYITRQRDIEQSDGTIFDVMIIGGGITGAGIASILSGNGVSTILVEKSDFASGTSQGSSKLIHGGLRYLQEYEFRLVRELLKERNYILSHVKDSRKIRFNILIGKSTWKKSTIRTGLFLYNLLGGKIRIPKYIQNKGNYPKQFSGFYQYEDGWCDDSRLVIYNIVTAHENGAICLNYSEFKGTAKKDQYFSSVIFDSVGKKEINVRSKMIINCAGPWAENIANAIGTKTSIPFKLSKGVHITVSRKKYPMDSGVAFMSHIDRRQMFIIPAGEVVIIGTTDNIISDPDDFNSSKKDIEYILESARGVLPEIQEKDIITSYAGIRPLIGDSQDPGKIPRDFVIKSEDGIINVFGGKLTNYRAASRRVAKLVSKNLHLKLRLKGMPEISYQRSETSDVYSHEVKYECPVFPEDILRRREAFQIYREDMGKSEEKAIIEAFREIKK